MARPTETRVKTVGQQGYGIAPSQSPGLRVVAPLDVRVGPSGAEALADALGLGAKVLGPVFQEKANKKAADAAVLGRSDQQMGTVNVKEQKKNESYALGVKRGMVDSAVVDYKKSALNFYENEFDKSKGTENLAQELDAMAKNMLGGYAKDPDAARWMTEEVAATMNTITGQHDKVLAAQFKAERVSSANALFRDDVLTGTTIDPQDYMNRLRPVLGGPAANEAYVDMVGALAVELGQPELVDLLIPETWTDPDTGEKVPGPKSVDGLNSKLNQAKYYARAAADDVTREKNKATQVQTDNELANIQAQASRGIDPREALDKMIADGKPISASDYSAVTNFYRSGRDEGTDLAAVNSFRAAMMTDIGSISPANVREFVGQAFANTPESLSGINQLWDDYQRTKEAALETEKNPKAKAYRAFLTNKFKLEKFASEQEQATYSAGLLAFDMEMISSKDADKALEAANKVFDSTSHDTSSGAITSSPTADAKSLASKKLSPAAFVKAHADVDLDSYMRSWQKGDLTKAELDAVISAYESN